MGAFAVPIMIATTVASTATSMYSAQQQSKMMEEDARARGRQAAAQAKEEEISRMQQYRDVQARNIAAMAAGGLASDSGTLGMIGQGNISNLEQDVGQMQLAAGAQQSYYSQAASNARKQGRIGMFNSLMQGASSLAGIEAQTAFSSPTGQGYISGFFK